MRVHHLDAGGTRPFGGRLFDGRPGIRRRAAGACHCLLIEHSAGLVLIDTGYGEQALIQPDAWVGRRLIRQSNPVLDHPIARQIEALGFTRDDVRDIIVTHLDLDHAGGLADFPAATVHVHRAELDAVEGPYGRREEFRYRRAQFAHGPKWSVYESDSDASSWFDFQAVRELRGLPSEILLVPLAGHTCGHVGVAVDTGDGWLLHAGDAYTYHGQLNAEPSMPVGTRLFQWYVDTRRQSRIENQQRLRELVRDHGDAVTVFSAHCATEFERLSIARRTA
ncbi:MBL fold metallo-hydrolase [Nocardia beijingensis]|uniref:MBL fold metallo-hydrolase n=1 Tax=Nocardia beijingensis TaxID=95162 RepID=UPI0018946E76|nr:MBL fold metallo-hydrolase [Nocardia beijingensis]MBF6468547.1 MBL fold metallo-hydrolase [Nocardia beijingensis]